jgi:glycosyltransferase involved in cell wall biosynthesis
MLSSPKNAVILSFEGPDPYSMVGGLGTRVTEMSAALAEAGLCTTLLFVGDPALPPVEQRAHNLELRRWCQWISAYHPGSVYDGELAKMNDFTASVPAFVAETIVAPAAVRGESVLIVAEDWQTAPAAIAIDALLRKRNLRDRAILTWNANNTYGFQTIDWRALSSAARITAVSRYMKFELETHGVEALVVPNGIPQRLLGGASKQLVRVALKELRQRRPLFVKVARFEEEKRWMQVIDAFAALVARHPEATLVIRGGREPYGATVLERARQRGIYVEDLTVVSQDPQEVLEAIAAAPGSIVNVRSFVPEETLLVLYHVADAVLANSGREPFGLVGLEVMAVGGVVVTGSTGEDYVEPFENALACDTGDARELAAHLEELVGDHDLALAIAAAGEATAKRYTWPRVLELLFRKLAAVTAPAEPPVSPLAPKSRAKLWLVEGRAPKTALE